jgi:hypothetical protein
MEIKGISTNDIQIGVVKENQKNEAKVAGANQDKR